MSVAKYSWITIALTQNPDKPDINNVNELILNPAIPKIFSGPKVAIISLKQNKP